MDITDFFVDQINDLKREDMGGMRLEPTEPSMLVWTGAIPGPEGSLYEGGLFEFDLTLPADYPYVLRCLPAILMTDYFDRRATQILCAEDCFQNEVSFTNLTSLSMSATNLFLNLQQDISHEHCRDRPYLSRYFKEHVEPGTVALQSYAFFIFLIDRPQSQCVPFVRPDSLCVSSFCFTF